MRIAVFGSGGFIGSVLCRELTRRGHDLSTFSTSRVGGIDPETGRLPEGFSLPANIDIVIYLAQSPYFREPVDPAHLTAVNVETPVALAKMGAGAGVSRFLYASTGSVYRSGFEDLAENAPVCGDSPYSRSKLEAERRLLAFQSRLRISIVRLFGVYGPTQVQGLVPNLYRRIIEERDVVLEPRPGDGDHPEGLRISLTHVDDVASALAFLSVTDGPDVVNVAAPSAASVRAIAETLGALTGNKPCFLTGSDRRGDLVADTTLLSRYLSMSWRQWTDGLDDVHRHWARGG